MSLSSQLSSLERQRWEDFCQRLGASIRAVTLVTVLDDCQRNPKLSETCREGASRLLNDELTILDVHRCRTTMLS